MYSYYHARRLILKNSRLVCTHCRKSGLIEFLLNSESLAIHSNHYFFGCTQNIKTIRSGIPQLRLRCINSVILMVVFLWLCIWNVQKVYVRLLVRGLVFKKLLKQFDDSLLVAGWSFYYIWPDWTLQFLLGTALEWQRFPRLITWVYISF